MPSPHEIRTARHRAGLTQSQAAALVGVQPRAWRYWEGGGRKMDGAAWELFLLKVRAETTLDQIPSISDAIATIASASSFTAGDIAALGEALEKLRDANKFKTKEVGELFLIKIGTKEQTK